MFVSQHELGSVGRGFLGLGVLGLGLRFATQDDFITVTNMAVFCASAALGFFLVAFEMSDSNQQ